MDGTTSSNRINPRESSRTKSSNPSSIPGMIAVFSLGTKGRDLPPLMPSMSHNMEQKRVNRLASCRLMIRTNASVRKENEPGVDTSPAKMRPQRNCMSSFLTSWQWPINSETQSLSTGCSETVPGISRAAAAVISSRFSCRSASLRLTLSSALSSISRKTSLFSRRITANSPLARSFASCTSAAA